jgi:hypothetical protein
MNRALQGVLAEATERAVSTIHADRADAESPTGTRRPRLGTSRLGALTEARRDWRNITIRSQPSPSPASRPCVPAARQGVHGQRYDTSARATWSRSAGGLAGLTAPAAFRNDTVALTLGSIVRRGRRDWRLCQLRSSLIPGPTGRRRGSELRADPGLMLEPSHTFGRGPAGR